MIQPYLQELALNILLLLAPGCSLPIHVNVYISASRYIQNIPCLSFSNYFLSLLIFVQSHSKSVLQTAAEWTVGTCLTRVNMVASTLVNKFQGTSQQHCFWKSFQQCFPKDSTVQAVILTNENYGQRGISLHYI